MVAIRRTFPILALLMLLFVMLTSVASANGGHANRISLNDAANYGKGQWAHHGPTVVKGATGTTISGANFIRIKPGHSLHLRWTTSLPGPTQPVTIQFLDSNGKPVQTVKPLATAWWYGTSDAFLQTDDFTDTIPAPSASEQGKPSTYSIIVTLQDGTQFTTKVLVIP